MADVFHLCGGHLPSPARSALRSRYNRDVATEARARSDHPRVSPATMAH